MAPAGFNLSNAIIQAKLSVGPADDPYEREADAVAARVVKSIRARSHGSAAVTGTASVVQPIQRAASVGTAGGEVDADTERVVRSAKSGGKLLPDGIRSKMETGFGADFGNIRVHEGAQATDLNNRIQAKAFTTGNSIFFRDGLPDMSSSSGQELLAHELTHTLQQGAAVQRSSETIQRWNWPWKHEPVAAPMKISEPIGVERVGPSPEGISAPLNVHARRGEGEIESLDVIDSSDRPDNETFRLGDADLSPYARSGPGEKSEQTALDADNPEMGKAPQGGAVPGPHQSFPDAEELGENDLLFPSPSSADIDLPTKAALDDDPLGVVAAYANYAGTFLKHTQHHDIKIEKYARYFEADYESVGAAKGEFEVAERGGQSAKMTQLTEAIGGNPIAEFAQAEERLKHGHIAEAAADREVPLVDGIYEQARSIEKKHQKSAGGRSITHTNQRIEELRSKRSDAAAKSNGKAVAKHAEAVQKHQARLVELQAAGEDASSLGSLVKQSKISESALFVKRRGLKVDKSTVKKEKGRGVGFGAHYKAVAGTKVKSAALSAVSLGVYAYEQEKTDGGYASEMRTTTMWGRGKAELARIQEMAEKRPYGPVTSLHAVLEGFSFIVKEIRNLLGSVTLLAMAASVIPGPHQPICAAIAAMSGTIAIGLAALKLLIDMILASWSVIERIRNSNARNSNLLTAQATSQGTAVLSGAITVGMAFAGPAIGNEAGGAAGYEGSYLSPEERIAQGGTATTSGDTNVRLGESGAGGRILGKGAAVGAKGGSSLAADAVGTVAGKAASHEEVNAAAAKEGLRQGMASQGRRKAQQEMPSEYGEGQQTEDPAWMKAAKADEAMARESSLDALITVHAAKIKRFHGKTQALMTSTMKMKSDAPAMASAAPAEDADAVQDNRSVIDLARGLGDVFGSVGGLSGDVDVEDIRAHAMA
ncbi:MAG: hypothetical protein ACI9N0_002440 [Ilumatobacter sp.]